jgi:hypothetical protein
MTVNGLPYLNAQIDSVLSKLDNVMLVACEFMRDTSIPLDDRWAVYLKVEKQLPVQSYFGRAIRELTDSVYDDFFPDGRGCMYNRQIDESLHENNPDCWDEEDKIDIDENDEWIERGRQRWIKRDAWREAVLQEQQGLVVFDW